MFIKHGDGKIMSVLKEDEVTEEQKKVATVISEEIKKKSDTNADVSEMKQSGR